MGKNKLKTGKILVIPKLDDGYMGMVIFSIPGIFESFTLKNTYILSLNSN
jgi:hypothetical protein